MNRGMQKCVPLDMAHQIIRQMVPKMEMEPIPIQQATGRVLSEDVLAVISVPPFRRAMMDGFALQSGDITGPDTIVRVVDAVSAGQTSLLNIQPGEAVRIMTGAPIPEGADAVARFEWCEETPDGVRIRVPLQSGESIQEVGIDGMAGQVIASAGTQVYGRQLATCYSFGVGQVNVFRRPKVSIIVTGNELVQSPSAPLAHGQIYGCNDLLIAGAVQNDGAVVQSVHYVNDEPAHLIHVMEQATKDSDFVLVTGGASMGDHDYVPTAFTHLGLESPFQRLWMRPGAPFRVARQQGCMVFSLSGNPAACYIQFEVLVRPALRQSMGMEDSPFPASGVLTEAVHRKVTKHTHVLRAKATFDEGRVVVDPDMAQSTGVISSLVSANCLVRIEQGQALAGAVVPLRWL